MLGNTIGQYRRKLGLTQEQLAQKLEVTNQAVSKWETDQCCPDVQLLPKLADVLGISLDALFGRKEKKETLKAELPWKNDDILRVVVYNGHDLIGSVCADLKDVTFNYEGPAKDIHCAVNLNCGDVSGSIQAGGYVECGDVEGNVDAEGYIECSDVGGYVRAGTYVECGDVDSHVSAGSYVECGDVGGNLAAGGYVECGDIGGNLSAGGHVECGDISGNAASGTPGGCNSSGSCDGCFNFNFNPFKK